MHIDFRTSFQRQGSYDFGTFSEDEIDLALNEAQINLIRGYLRNKDKQKGFEANSITYTDLENLIVRGYTLYPYIINDKKVGIELPQNFLEYIESRSVITCDIQTRAYQQLSIKFLVPVIPITDLSINISSREIPNFSICNLSDTINLTSLLADVDTYYYLKNFILDSINNVKQGINATYEGKGIYKVTCDSSFLLKRLNLKYKNANGIEFKYDYMPTGVSGVLFYSGKDEVEIPNRLVAHEDINYIVQNPFSRPSAINNVVELAAGKLFNLHKPDKGIKTINLDYIRNPKMISLRNDQTTELGSTYGSKNAIATRIVDLAVYTIALRIGGANAQGEVSLNNNNNNN